MKKFNIVPTLLSFLLVFFISWVPSLYENCNNMTFISRNICRLNTDVNFFNYVYPLIFILLCIIISKMIKEVKKVEPLNAINAFIFSVFILIYKCFKKAFTITILWANIYNIIMTVVFLISMTTFLYLLINYLELLINKYKDSKIKVNKVWEFIFYKHPFLSAFILTISMSLFYLIFFYPGTVSYDGVWQLNLYYRVWTFNDHHPAILTLIMGGLLDFGRYLGSENLGVFIYVMIQAIINALTFAYCLKIQEKIDSPFIVRVLTLMFYAFLPFWTINSITLIKDIIYYLIFLFIFVYQYYHIRIMKDMRFHRYLILLIMYLFLFCTRNTGLYVGIICMISLLIYNIIMKEKKACIILIIISILSANYIYGNIFLPKMDILPALIRERMSIPLQQTARYIKYYPNDITKEEKDKIQKLFKCDIMELPNKYNPVRSDHIKQEIFDYPSNEILKDYYKAWFSMFFKHPFIYIDATLENTYGYFFSDKKNYIGEELGFYGIESRNNKYHISFREGTEEARNNLYQIANIVSNLPLIGFLYSCPIYVWILIFISFQLLKRKKIQSLILCFPLYVTLLMCIVSPVNGHMRYLQPIAVSTPMLISFFIYEISLKEKTTKRKPRSVV